MAKPDQEHETLDMNGRGYEAERCTVLDLRDAIRRRPSMYVGDTEEAGLHNLVHELLDSALDEVRAGLCDRITILLHEDGSCTVTHNGRGAPTVLDFSTGDCEFEFGRPASGGPSRIGLAVVNALSSWFTITTGPRGLMLSRRYERGVATGPLMPGDEMPEEGTIIRFQPDPEIFRGTGFSFEDVKYLIDNLVFPDGELMVILDDKRDRRTYLCGRGVRLIL